MDLPCSLPADRLGTGLLDRIDLGGDALIEALYRGVTDGVAFQRALELLQSAIGANATALVSLDVQQPVSNLFSTTGVFDEAMRQRYAAEFGQVDPAPATFARMSLGTASTSDRIFSDELLRTSPFLHEFLRPMGVAETMGGMLRAGSGRFEMLGIQRGTDRDAFSDAEIAAVEQLLPHLARVMQLRRVFLTQQIRMEALEATLDRSGAGITVYDPDGAVSFVNAAMQAIARRGDGLGLDKSGRLIATDMTARKRLDALFADVLRGGAGGVASVPCRTNLRPYAVLVAPALRQTTDTLLPMTAHAVMTIAHDPHRVLRGNAERLRDALNLPPGAAELAVALAAGHDLRSFAAAQAVTIHTARFHLRTALARTGSRTQADLVRVVVSLLRDLENLGLEEPPVTRP